jgi:hypothetical protein
MDSYAPVMAEVFGFKPWDLDRLTYAQWCRFRQYIDDKAARAEDGR